MRFVFDENLPQSLPKAMATTITNDDFEHTIDVVGRGATDEAIFATLAMDPDAVLITLDVRQTRTPHIRQALEASGITVIYLADGWADIDNLTRLELFCRWWPMIKDAVEAYERGVWFEVPRSRALRPLKPMPQSRRRKRSALRATKGAAHPGTDPAGQAPARGKG